ncbi:related to DNA repair protein rad18 [Cephalotrichum gorgonifer]|uniref:Related to DNA repair protein rad18 n=1 Tax=Cephalotrichum gorgonifer TaxID=2041049 RepID=A0AAE8MXB1_9PEZI|nr:related to DNA repair protein rad18 [Cephalotrichum gorgonifer]
MPREKRPRHTAEEDGEEFLVGTQANSGSRVESNRKRVRISDAAPSNRRNSTRHSTPESDSSDSGDDTRAPTPDGADSPPRTQYEIFRDRDYSHLEHEAEDDMRATQKVLGGNRAEVQGENRAANNGIIETVTCVNFMCHTRLHVELGPLLNFIVGENGSGKSAVLTAITLCLGAKASSTNRGGSLKSFIKEGQDQSTIQVKLKNQGEGAYQPEVFGESIIVERHFTKNGTSGFKLKSSLNRVISTKRRDIDELVEYFCLQMDNPLNVLSQDNARQFLNASTPSLKYNFFVKGVQLEALDNDYKLIMQTVDDHGVKLLAAAEYVKRLEREYQDAHRDMETLKKNEALREKRRLYRNQLIWAQVVEKERLLEKENNAIAIADQRIARAEQKVQEQTQILELADEALKQAEESVASMKTEEEALVEKEAAAKEAFAVAKAELTTLHHEERTARDRLKLAQEDVKAFEAKIAEEERRLTEATGDGRARKEAEFDAAKEEVGRIEHGIKQSQAKVADIKARLEEAKGVQAGLKESVNAKRVEVRTVEKRIHELQQDRGSGLAGFDPNIPRLLKMIDDDRGFEHKPIGPIGRHVQLLKPEWSTVIERVLGGTPSAFITRSQRDNVRLRGLMKRAGVQKTPILISNGRSLNLEGKEPDPHFDTILRVLQFENNLIRDQLVINHKIEQTLLIRSRKEAEKVIFVDRPRNVAFGLCHHDRIKGEGISLQVNNRGDQSLDPVKPRREAPRLQSDNEAQILHQQEILTHLREELRDMQNRLREVDQRIDGHVGELKRESAAITRLEKERRVAIANADNLETEMDRFEGGDVEIELENLRDALKTAQAKVDHEGQQYGDMVVKKPDINAKCEELSRAMKAESATLAQFRRRVDQAKNKVNNKTDARSLALSAKNEAFEQSDQAKIARQMAMDKRDKVATDAAALEEQAQEAVGDRVHISDNEDYKSIEAKYKALMMQLEKLERRLGASEQEITERAEKAQSSYDGAKRKYESQSEVQRLMQDSLNGRLNKWRDFQRYLSARTRVNFNYLLSERGFRGKMLIDHRSRRLVLQVEPDETRKGGGGRETKTLSGGEKSFASICMLLAIWEAMGSSIRCLDEFDVFMDNINRAISTNMLITAARRSVSRQYILITPNAIEGRAKLDKDVKIIRLSDPRQRTIPGMQQQQQ